MSDEPTEDPTEVLPRVAASPRPRRRTPLVARLRAEAPLLAVLAVVAVALWRVGLQHWREGTTLLGAALLLGAGLRGFCDEAAAGLLAVRSRRVDVLLYAAFGLVVILVSLTITGGPLASR